MIANTSTLRDAEGRYPDWIELHNTSDFAINLERYGLSDDPLEPVKWRFPHVVLEGGGYLVVAHTDLFSGEGGSPSAADGGHKTVAVTAKGPDAGRKAVSPPERRARRSFCSCSSSCSAP